MTAFLLITSKLDYGTAMIPVATTMEADTSARPLAVVRIRADRTATVMYFRADRLPDIRAALARVDLAVLPPPPIPEDLERLGYEWSWGPGLEAHRMLVAKEYHRATDWAGIGRALREAKAVGIASDRILVEAEDGTTLDAVIRLFDLCLGSGFRPVLGMQ